MSFKSFLKGLAVVGLGIVTFGGSIAAAAATAGAWLTSGTIGATVARTLLAVTISKLVSNRAGTKGAGGDAPSARFQARPSTTNKIPLVYGSGYYGTVITDAIISTDNKTMWYVMACAEVTDTGTLSFGDMYIDNRLITFDGTDQTKVVSLTNNANPPQVDTNIDGNMYVYKFNNGSSSGVNTAQTAIQILQDSAIPVDRRWTSTDTMTDTAFVIVKLNYNYDKQVTGLGELKVNMINTLNKPGAVLLDYMQNTRYGCAIPITQIDTASLTALDSYSDQLITYTPDGGGSATQARYRINGPIDLNINCLSNLQNIADACDSWIQYSELVGKWKVVINKPYDGVLNDLYSVDSSVLIGGIDITPIDLNQTYNSVEVQFPSGVIKDQNVVRVIDLTDPATDWYEPTLLSPNEASNRLTIPYQIVNNYVQAVYLGVRRLLQSREDLTINCNLDYSGIQIEAGDVVRVTLAEYGWTDKLFRVSTVSEIKREDGNLGASIIAFEYNDTIYNDQAIQDYVPADNTGLTDPNVFDTPTAPTIANGPIANSAINYFTVTSTVPTVGSTIYMDFNYGNTSNVLAHKSYSSVQTGDGTLYTSGSTVTINVADLDPGTYYWSATARNDVAGKQSNSSAAFNWVGPSVTNYDKTSNIGGVTYNNMQPNGAGFLAYHTFDPRTTGGGPPVLVTSTSQRNRALIFPGTAIGANDVFPWYQGTGSGSTGPWTPNIAQVQAIAEGTDGWYKAIYVDLSSDNLQADEIGQLWGTLGFLGDVNNIQYQLCRYACFTGSATSLQLQTRSMQTYFTGFKEPYPTHITISDWAAGSGTGIAEWGYMIRNITPGSNLSMFHGALSVKQQKLNP